jgi:acetolactate synthase I/II/III large subunit
MKMTGAQILIEVLKEQGADTVFGYPGGAVLNIYDELYKNSQTIRHIISCHEQGAAHAADGYSRATGKTGVVIATSGPGATNLVTGIANAYLDSVPMVAITGNVAVALIGRDSFQEVDIIGITMPVTKHNYIVKDVCKLADTVREAFLLARSGRPGPVLVDIPKDVQAGICEYERKTPAASLKAREPSMEQMDSAAALIAASQRPYLYIGGGVVTSGASEELVAFAEQIDAPIGSSMMGLSAVPHGHPLFLGMTGMHGRYAASKVMSRSDLLIAVGTRFSDRATGNKPAYTSGRKVLHIDIDPAEIGKNIPAYASLIGDVKKILQRLLAMNVRRGENGWHAEMEEIRNAPDSHLGMNMSRLNPQMVIEEVNRRAGDGIVATDVGQHQMWTAQYYHFRKPRTFITSGGLGTMGFGMGSAIGACVGSGGKKTVLFTSDGSFHMNMNEMATAVSFHLPLVIVLLNNRALGMVRQWQTLFYDKRYSNTSLGRKTDYKLLAEAFGATGLRVCAMDELADALDTAFAADGPVLIDVAIDPDEKVLPMIPPGGTINDIILKG